MVFVFMTIGSLIFMAILIYGYILCHDLWDLIIHIKGKVKLIMDDLTAVINAFSTELDYNLLLCRDIIFEFWYVLKMSINSNFLLDLLLPFETYFFENFNFCIAFLVICFLFRRIR